MDRGRTPRELDQLFDRWYSREEIETLQRLNLQKLRQRAFVTAETILRRCPPEEAGSALAALRINFEIADKADWSIEQFLKTVLELLHDDESREDFKVELRAFVGGD